RAAPPTGGPSPDGDRIHLRPEGRGFLRTFGNRLASRPVAHQDGWMRPWVKIVCVILIVALAGSALVTAAGLLLNLF
ncbi:hypothetical protein, partial [Nonomuraea africana]